MIAIEAGNYAIDVLKRAGESAGDAASSIFSEIQNVAEQTQRGWQRTTDSVEVPELSLIHI